MILKGYIGPAQRWVGYTVAASVIDILLRPLFFRMESVFVLAMLFYLTRSGLQWLVLRTLVKRAWLWIVAGVAAGMAYSLVVSAVGENDIGAIQRNLVIGLLSSSLTAAAEIGCLIRFRRK